MKLEKNEELKRREIAKYNAGEERKREWAAYCNSRRGKEYQVPFAETWKI